MRDRVVSEQLRTPTTPVRPDGGPPAVLVVDDEWRIVDLLADLLEDEGYTVTRAYDGAGALEAVARCTPDLVIADVMMPRLDGLALTAELRRRGLTMPVILMSAVVRPRANNVIFVPKPFDIDAVLALIEHTLAD